jgi:hypothetical protein
MIRHPTVQTVFVEAAWGEWIGKNQEESVTLFRLVGYR